MASQYQVVLLDSILSRRKDFKRRLMSHFDVTVLATQTELGPHCESHSPDIFLLSLRQMGTHGLKVAKELRRTVGDDSVIIVYGDKPRSLNKPRKELEEAFRVNAFIPFSPEYAQLEASVRAELVSIEKARRRAELAIQQEAEAKAKSEADAQAKSQQQEALRSKTWGELLRSEISPSTLKHLFTKPIRPKRASGSSS